MTRFAWTCRARCIVSAAAAAWLAAMAPIAAQDQAASLSGVVLAADGSESPVRRALVTVTDLSTSVRISDATDDAGRFEFPNLRPGRYTVAASKPLHLTTALGASRPGRPGTTLVLEAGQRTQDVRLWLARGGVVSGTIRDGSGVPAANLSVIVARAESAAGIPAISVGPMIDLDDHAAVRRVLTDDRGIYRVAGLLPGEYVIGVTAIGVAAASAPTGGRYGYAPTYYPGTAMADEARRVRVAAGEVIEGLDFSFELVRTMSVEGVVIASDTLQAIGVVSMQRIGAAPEVRATNADAGGRFVFRDVTPGRYLVRAWRGALGQDGYWGRAEVTTFGADITGLTLPLQPAMTFSGRLVVDGLAEPPPSVRVELRAPAGTAALGEIPRPSHATATRPNGTFEIRGIMPGRQDPAVVVPARLGPGWWLESAISGGRDLLDMPLEFGMALGSIDDAVLTLTNRRTALTGRLQTPAGLPATDYYIIVCSADRTHWYPGARRTRAVRPASDGTFSIGELPAGSYLVAAVTDVIDGEWQRASFLEQLAAFAVPVTVRAGETTRQDLQIAGGR